jgi:predicted nucleotidyltransferase
MEFRDYTIDAISFGGIEYGPFTVSETEGENLLGMDILSSFGALNINFEQGSLKLN